MKLADKVHVLPKNAKTPAVAGKPAKVYANTPPKIKGDKSSAVKAKDSEAGKKEKKEKKDKGEAAAAEAAPVEIKVKTKPVKEGKKSKKAADEAGEAVKKGKH